MQRSSSSLAKAALAALALAAVAPQPLSAGECVEGVFLAAGCAEHGCASDKAPASASSSASEETKFLDGLDSSSRSSFLKLSPEGKALAIKLAAEGKQKSEAVKEAQKK